MADEEGLIDPDAVWIPKLKAEELQATANDLIGDGDAVATSGSDIKSAWQGLQEVYAAPEAETLFSAVDPVADNGDDIQDALATVGDALKTFAQEAEKCRQHLIAAKDDAEDFLKSIEDDENWREDEEKVALHESIRIEINQEIRNYQNWERSCANQITATFGGTTFIGADPNGPTLCKPGEQRYGVRYIPEDAAMPWGAPQEVDHPWWIDSGHALGDIGLSGLEATGFYGTTVTGEKGGVYPLSSQWFSNMGDQLKDGAAFAGALTGFYDYKTGELGLGSRPGDWAYEWAENFYPAWTEVGHAFVPWRERHDRPAYVVTQAVVNIGTLGVGAALKLGKLPQLHGDAPGPNALPDLVDRVPDAADPSRPGTSDLPSVADLRNRLDELETAVNDEYSPAGAMDAVGDIPLREHAVSGVPETQANGDGPEGTDFPPSTTPAPNPSAATDGPSAPAGDGGGSGSSTPPNAGGSGGQPPSPEGEGGRVGGDGAEQSDRPEPPSRSGQQQPPQDGPEGTPEDDQPVDKPSVSPAPSDLPGDAGPGGTPADDRPSSGAGEASSGLDDGEQVPRQTDQLSEAEFEKRLQKANIVEQKLRDGGLTNDEISQLFDEHPRHGDQWQRAHSALNQSFNKKVNAELHPEAVRFAFQGADDPREFAYRYEYFKAIYDEQVDHVKNLGPETHPGVSRNIAALERFREIDVHAQLREDHARVSEVWGSDPARVDPSSSRQEIDQALRASAEKIGMGHPTSASYHAHKHFKELPLDEQSDDKIYSYHQSATQTIQTGDIVEYERNKDGGIELAYQRTTYDGLGNPLGTLKARIVVRPDGLPIMKTYMGGSG